jgi:Lipocalin-like domain
MKTSFRLLAMLCLFGTLALPGCKKDEDAAGIIVGDCWTLSKEEYQDAATTDWSDSAIDACDADDCLDFIADGTLSTDMGALKCNTTVPQTIPGKWSLSSDGKKITLILDNSFPVPLEYSINELNDTKMVIVFDFGSDKQRLTFTR